MACQMLTVRKVGEHQTLKRCVTHGIAIVEDGSLGGAHSAHANIQNGKRAAEEFYGPTSRIVVCHGWAYNTARVVVSDEYDEMAREACHCGGTH